MNELDKLEKYLKEKQYKYVRIDEEGEVIECFLPHIRNMRIGERHQIIVFDDADKKQWDAICHSGSYGYEQGLLEIMGTIVKYFDDKDEESDVVGYLQADDIIKALEKEGEQKNGRKK